MTDQNEGWTRRNWLALVGGATLAASPLGMLLSSLADRKSGVAQAQGTTAKRLVSIYTAGGPPRWMFDLFLNPRGEAGLVRSPGVINTFTGSGDSYTEGNYTLSRIGEFYVPYLWTREVPKPGGGTRPLAGLLSSLLNIRGLTTGNPAHPASEEYFQLPVTARYSIAAMAALPSKRPFAAVAIDYPGLPLGSAADKIPLTSLGLPLGPQGNANHIESLLRPFLPASASDSTFNEPAARQTVQNALAALHAASKSNFAKHEILETSWTQAKQMADRDLTALMARWPGLFSKYKALVDTALSPHFVTPLIDDKAIIVGSATLPAHFDGGLNLPAGSDARAMFHPVSPTVKPNLDQAAAAFAMMEFLIAEDLSDSVSARIAPIQSLNVGGVAASHGFDEHNCSAGVSALINTRFTLAVGACLLEFIEVLKSLGKYQDTVIQLAGEFNRNPRADMSGSDHAFQGASVSLFSGQIEKTYIIGNVLRSGTDPIYPGTWGDGAPVLLPGQTAPAALNVGCIAATLATMLGVPSPVSAFESLVMRNAAGKIIPRLPTGSFV